MFEKFLQNDTDDIQNNHYGAVRKKYNLPDRYLLCLATLEPRKNLSFLVESYLGLLQENSIEIPLVLAGRKGWKVESFLETIESKYMEYIIVTGFIDDEDLPYIYKIAECFDIGDKEGLKKAIKQIITANEHKNGGLHQIKERCEQFKWEYAVQNILADLCGDD